MAIFATILCFAGTCMFLVCYIRANTLTERMLRKIFHFEDDAVAYLAVHRAVFSVIAVCTLAYSFVVTVADFAVTDARLKGDRPCSWCQGPYACLGVSLRLRFTQYIYI